MSSNNGARYGGQTKPKERQKREGGNYFAVPLEQAEDALTLGLEAALAGRVPGGGVGATEPGARSEAPGEA